MPDLTPEIEHQIVKEEDFPQPVIDTPADLEMDKRTPLTKRLAEAARRCRLCMDGEPDPIGVYYRHAQSHDARRPRFRDHGIVSALILLKVSACLRDRANRLAALADNPFVSRYRSELADFRRRLNEVDPLILAAAQAIALHNVNREIEPRGGSRWRTNVEPLLDSFDVGYGYACPLAFLLGLADSLQEWDRPIFRAPTENDKEYTDQDIISAVKMVACY